MTDTPDKIWWSAAELADAALPDLPTTKRKINERAKSEGWAKQPGKIRRRPGRGGGLEYHYTLLPVRARLALLPQPEQPALKGKSRPSRTEAWASFEELTTRKKDKAREKHAVLMDVVTLERAGLTRTEAVRAACKKAAKGEKTLWNWFAQVDGIAEADWLAYLAPKAGGSTARVEIDPEFFELVKSAWLQQGEPPLTAAFEWAEDIAKKEGLPVPEYHQVLRLLNKTVDEPTRIYWRKGVEALRRFYPHQERDKSAMHALECVCGDFHKFDVFVNWPGEEKPVRPQMVAFSDVYSGKLLAWRLSLTANSDTVRLVFGDLVERYGIPGHALLDNGREFAGKVFTGGAKTRFRFKIQEDEIVGLLPTLGIEIHWAQPYWGQAKPIERQFRDVCDRFAKHPEFVGAYTGNKPTAKPENYGSKAVDYEVFKELLNRELNRYNARPGRRSEVAFGKSFDEVFETSYQTSPIRKATAEQRRLWLMGAEGLRANSKNGELKLHGTRYWSDWMHMIAGQKVIVRFDPDNLHADVHVYHMDGSYIGAAAALERGDFLSVEAAKEVQRKRNAFIRATRDQARTHKALTDAEIAARLRADGKDVTPGELPEAKVVRMVQPHKQAAQVQRPAPPQYFPVSVARLDDRRPKRGVEFDPEQQFERAMELEAALAEGKPVSSEQLAWLENFQTSADYRTQKKMRDAFGGNHKG